jgi:hypothetical protein
MAARLAALALAGLMLAACGSPAAPPPRAQYDVVAEALRAFERHEWALAARLLREAVVKQPSSLRLHYALAIAASHLDLLDETTREFEWVVANAPGTAEAEVARRWLTNARRERAPAAVAAEPPPLDKEIGRSALSGQVVWNGGEPPVKVTRMRLFLRGVPGTPTKDIQYVLRTDEDGRFRFANIAAGSFKLTDRIAGQPVWRLRVEIPADQSVSLQLGPDNSLRARDDFPDDK